MKEIGKVYKNYMVDLKLSNKKLSVRGLNIIKEVTGCSDEIAKEKLEQANGHVKLAIVMILFNLNKKEAEDALEKAHGYIHKIK